jgi:hypothetical protein
MAIGKVNAYATVQGANVDFGDIALNAQKIQQADMDRMKSMIPEPKKSSYKYEETSGGTERSNVAIYDKALTETVSKLTTRATELNKKAESEGVWSAEDRAELNSINNSLKTYDASTKLFTEKAKGFSEDYAKGVYSGLGEKNMDFLEKLSQVKNTDISYENGKWTAKLVATDDNGDPIKNEDGSYVYEKYNDRGVLKDSVSLDDLNSGKFFNSFIKKVDTPSVVKKIASNLDPTFQVTDNGVTKHTTTFFNDKQKDALNTYVNSYFSEVDKVADFLYQNQGGDTWKEPMTMDEYKKNGGLDLAKNQLKNQVESAFGFKDQKDVTLKNNEGGKDKPKVFSAPLTIDDVVLYDGKLKQKFNKNNFSNTAIGLTGMKPYNSPGLGYNMPEYITYDKKNKQVLIGGSVVTDTNIRFTRDDGTKSVINDIEDLNPQEQDRFIQSTFGNKDKTTNFLRRPTGAMKTRILQATGFKDWNDLERYFSKGNVR